MLLRVDALICRIALAKTAALALERTASSVFDLIETTYRSGERELRLIEAQEFYAHPRMQFTAKQVR